MVELSIVIPVYNAERFLRECLDSVYSQLFTNFEVILVNDGSTDNSLEICKKYAAKHKNITVIDQNNMGQVGARKKGLSVCKGRYVGFIDSDDWIDSDWYDRLVNSALKVDADIAIGDNVIDNITMSVPVKQGFGYGVYEKEDIEAIIYPGLAFRDFTILGFSPSNCTKIFKRELITFFYNRVPEFFRYGEDAAATYPCMVAANRIVYVENCSGYHYRVQENSVSHTDCYDSRYLIYSHLYNEFPSGQEGLKRQICLYGMTEMTNYIVNALRSKHALFDFIEKCKKEVAWETILDMHDVMKFPFLYENVFLMIRDNDKRAGLLVQLYILLSDVKRRFLTWKKRN